MKKIGVVLLLIVGIVVVYFFILSKPEKEETLPNFVGMTMEEVQSFAQNHNIHLIVEEQYSEQFEEGKIMDQNIPESTNIKEIAELKVQVSLGNLSPDVLREYQVNELGKIPVMMYHGIYNVPSAETPYTGGNYDKDGYQRTAEAFRADLEFYYNSGYRMIRLIDYVQGNMKVPLGKSPIVLTFDDGLANNILVTGLDDNGEIVIDPNSAVGILEEFKKKYPDFQVTATFFVNGGLFRQTEYDEKILHWLINNGYDIGNHSYGHTNLRTVDSDVVQMEIGRMYQKLHAIIENKFVPIVALPFGEPLNKSHANFPWILKGSYENIEYETLATMRVGSYPDHSPFHKNFDPTFIQRIRAYDYEGSGSGIAFIFQQLEKNRYISDGREHTITIPKEVESSLLEQLPQKIISY